VYEWVYFLVFQTPGDFIANRSYADTPGSWSQSLDFGGLNLLRIKSTQGEPSFLSVVVLPYLYLAAEQRRRLLAAVLLFVAIFSTSTSAFFGLAFGAIVTGLFRRKFSWRDMLLVGCIATALAVCYFAFPDIYANLFTDKLAGATDSGAKRQFSPLGIVENFFELPPLQWFSGVGFGYTYANVGISLLFNCGLSGVALFAFGFLSPVFRLPSNARGIALKTGLAVMFFLFLISVAELFLPTTWMFLGLAYWQLASTAKSVDRSDQFGSFESSADANLPHLGNG
jgi:MFS family permease